MLCMTNGDDQYNQFACPMGVRVSTPYPWPEYESVSIIIMSYPVTLTACQRVIVGVTVSFT